MRRNNAMYTNFYRHPERQGPRPEEACQVQHDIYSLGICLLEVGLWDTFVRYSAEGVAEAPGAALDLTLDEIRRRRPKAIKEHLIALAKQRLP